MADQGRDIAHTSVITTLNIMVDKKFLTRKRDGKSYLFSAKIAREQVSNGLLNDLVDRVFDGSAGAMMLNLLNSSNLDEDELKELRLMINRKVRENKHEGRNK